LLNCSEFSGRLSKITQALYSITGTQFRVGSRGLDKRWSLGSVCISRCSSARERRLRSFAQFGCQFIDTAHIALPQKLASPVHLLVKYEDRLGTYGSADPNCSVLTIRLAPSQIADRNIARSNRFRCRS
jgi:hypothetical protein